jgi:dipeptidyl aminopeptidase/acylaminoacyl peptidase
MLRRIALGTLASVLALPSSAQTNTAPMSADDLVRTPVSDLIRFSPDGTHFAARVERQGQLVLAVIELKTNKGRVFNSDRGSDLADFRWLTNDLIAVTTNKLGVRAFDQSRRDYQPAYVSLDGKSRADAETIAEALRAVPGTSDLIVPRQRASDYGSVELALVDSNTGQVKRRLTDDPPGQRIYEWLLDSNLAPRAALGYNIRTRKLESWWRETAGAKWQMMSAFNWRVERGFFPVAIDATGDMWVLSNIATGRYALHKFDLATGKPGELLAGHPRHDIAPDDLIYDRKHLPVGVRVQADRVRFFWFDDARADAQRLIDASLPGRVNTLQFLPDGRVLVHSASDVEPGAYYFYDPAARAISEWSRAMPWLRADRLSRTEAWEYKARDGLDIQAYVTWPRSASPEIPVPMLVWLHGGPANRDHWGFDPIVQYLASRGYAVFQPNFRGSTGFGRDHELAGHRQWGLKMQDDVTDGVRALIRRGRVDAKRICIGGASYGGYAALMGVIREPEIFPCAIDLLGPTDLVWMVESGEADYNRRRGSFVDQETDEGLKVRIGDPDDAAQRKQMEANSPRLIADRVKVPVQLIYGTDDWRVPLKHGTAMRDALRDAGASVEWKSYAGEGHGIWDRNNQVDLFVRIEKFLAHHIGSAASR